MYRVVCICVVLWCSGRSVASALSIHYGGNNASMPFEIRYPDVRVPLDIVLKLTNNSNMTATVLGWQLDVELRPLEDSQGSVLFEEVFSPPNTLFGGTSQPISYPELPPPTDALYIQDFDPEFTGRPIAQYEARNIVNIRLVASANSSGRFQLVMPIAENPEFDSSWLDADDFLPKVFENAATSDFAGYILLGTINVGRLPGDYNSDGNITADDYHFWVATFGTSVDPGSSADGNSNGINDVADYLVWRRYSSIVGTNVGEVNDLLVPEPACAVSAMVMIMWFASLHRRP